MSVIEMLAEVNDEALTLDDLDSALVGFVERFGMPPVALYDKAKVLAAYQKQGMTEEEAVEFFEYNTIGAWMGEGTPAFVTFIKKESE